MSSDHENNGPYDNNDYFEEFLKEHVTVYNLKRNKNGFKIFYNFIITKEIIGRGSFGVVKRGYYCSLCPHESSVECYHPFDKMEEVAIKVLHGKTVNKIYMYNSNSESINNELKAILLLKYVQNTYDVFSDCPLHNFVRIHEVICSPISRKYYIIMEYCKISLEDFVYDIKENQSRLSVSEVCATYRIIKWFGKQLSDCLMQMSRLNQFVMVNKSSESKCKTILKLLGMIYKEDIEINDIEDMFRRFNISICHMDIKPSNILIDSDGCLKLVDFGMSNILVGCHNDDYPSNIIVNLSTPAFIAPEQLVLKEHDGFIGINNECLDPLKIDIWCYGLVVYFMIYGSYAFCNNMPEDEDLSDLNGCCDTFGTNTLLKSIYTSQLSFKSLSSTYLFTNKKMDKNSDMFIKEENKDLEDFLHIVLSKNPHIRPDIGEIRGHHWIKDEYDLFLLSNGSMSFRNITHRVSNFLGRPSTRDRDSSIGCLRNILKHAGYP